MRRKIFSNIWLKGAALLMAVFLWFFVQFRGQNEMSVLVEPQFSKLPPSLILTEKRPDTVEVTLRGNSIVLGRLKPGDVTIPLKLKDMQTGRIFIPFGRGDVRVPPHVSVVSVSPSRIRVYIERKATAVLPVKPDIKGRPAPGFFIYQVRTTPDQAEAEGPQETLDRLGHLETGPVDISGANDTLDEDVDIKIPDKIDSVIPARVRVKVIIRRK
ncbi:MAG: CdaR family protein [Nitrospiraceae bacterium]|nr:CdaR family protein [Nitrospiraceae bacterium]